MYQTCPSLDRVLWVENFTFCTDKLDSNWCIFYLLKLMRLLFLLYFGVGALLYYFSLTNAAAFECIYFLIIWSFFFSCCRFCLAFCTLLIWQSSYASMWKLMWYESTTLYFWRCVYFWLSASVVCIPKCYGGYMMCKLYTHYVSSQCRGAV